MCLCLKVIWTSLLSVFCCCCLITEDKRKRKKKKRAKGEKRSQYGDKSSGTVGLKTVSDIPEEELVGKHQIVLPKDGCNTPEEYIRRENYEINYNTLLGRGGYGMVYKAIKIDTKAMVAVKVLDLNKNAEKHRKQLNSLKNELFIATALKDRTGRAAKHDHIIQYLDRYIFEYKVPDSERVIAKAYIFMELASEGNLEQQLELLGRMDDKTAKRYFSQIVYAVEYMHGNHIAHRDLKLENYLLVKSKTDFKCKDIKVSDFGLSRVHYKQETGIILTDKTGGTSYYKAPEILLLQHRLSDDKVDPFKADVWALGVSLFRMLTNEYPFETKKDILTAIECQLNKSYKYPKDVVIDKSAKELMERLLEPMISKRPFIWMVKIDPWLADENTLTVTQSEHN